MKLNRLFRPPPFWTWIRAHLPPSMESHEISWGYGVCCNIYRKGDAPNAFMRAVVSHEGYPIATVHSLEVRLNEPQYFADFEDLLKKYEALTGIETTLTYWQSPKDEPSRVAAEQNQSQQKG